MKSKKYSAIFLDRDGVINVDHGFVHQIEKFDFLPGVKDALRIMKVKGYLLILVTNQAGIAYGYYTEEDHLKLDSYMQEELRKEGLAFDATYFCPHHSTKGIGKYRVECECRKPKPGMLLNACREFNIDIKTSYMVGDRMTDIEAGRNAGCVDSFLVKTGKPLPNFGEDLPNFVKDDLLEVAKFIPSCR